MPIVKERDININRLKYFLRDIKLERQKLVTKDSSYKKRRKAIFISYKHFCCVIHEVLASELANLIASRLSIRRRDVVIFLSFFFFFWYSAREKVYRAFLTLRSLRNVHMPRCKTNTGNIPIARMQRNATLRITLNTKVSHAQVMRYASIDFYRTDTGPAITYLKRKTDVRCKYRSW